MADNKNYYYIRLKDSFFDEESVKILESMPDGYLYSNILLKLYLRSLKFDGCLMYNERIPYNSTVLATLTGHNVGTVEKALGIFKELELIDILDNGAIYMLDIQNYIGKSSTEADRKREYRNRIERDRLTAAEGGQMSIEMSGQMSGQNSPENRDKSKENKDKSIEIESTEVKRVNYQLIADMYNDTCVSFPRLTKLSDSRKKAIKARLNTYSIEDFKRLFEKAEASSFLKGKNDRNWSANFDWLIKDSNMAKVLEGNYDKPNKAAPATKSNAFHNYPQRQYDYEAMERMLLNQQAPPETAATNPDIKARAEALQKELGGS